MKAIVTLILSLLISIISAQAEIVEEITDLASAERSHRYFDWQTLTSLLEDLGFTVEPNTAEDGEIALIVSHGGFDVEPMLVLPFNCDEKKLNTKCKSVVFIAVISSDLPGVSMRSSNTINASQPHVVSYYQERGNMFIGSRLYEPFGTYRGNIAVNFLEFSSWVSIFYEALSKGELVTHLETNADGSPVFSNLGEHVISREELGSSTAEALENYKALKWASLLHKAGVLKSYSSQKTTKLILGTE